MSIFNYLTPIVDEWIANRIYARRQQIGLTQVELSIALGCSQGAFSKMENARLSPTFTVATLCRMLKVDPEKFFRRDIDFYGLNNFLEADAEEREAKERLLAARKKKARAISVPGPSSNRPGGGT